MDTNTQLDLPDRLCQGVAGYDGVWRQLRGECGPKADAELAQPHVRFEKNQTCRQPVQQTFGNWSPKPLTNLQLTANAHRNTALPGSG
jgi:hypothetical protein